MSKVTYLAPSWRQWVLGNLRRSCTPESIVSIMVKDNFDPNFARDVVSALARETSGAAAGDWPGGLNPVFVTAASAAHAGSAHRARGEVSSAWIDNPNPAYALEASRIPQGNTVRTGDRVIRVVSRLSRPEVLVLADVLSQEECRELIDRAREKLERSTTVDPVTGQLLAIKERTSFGTFFSIQENEFISRIDQRLSELLAWPVDHGEGLQILHYQVGGEYQPHFDYFPPSQGGSTDHLAQGGQRVASLVIYLNDVEEGGETIFPEIGLSVVPRQGCAVYFSYCNSQNQLDPLTLHAGTPIRRGEKWIATKWLRQHRRA